MQQKNFLKKVKSIILDIVWSHWNRLGVMGEGAVNVCSTDPEALILLTALCGYEDPRLIEVMNIWLKNYESVIMIERLKRYSEAILPRNMADFKRLASLKFSFEQIFSKSKMKRWNGFFEILNEKGVESDENSISKKISESRKKLREHKYIIQNNLQIALRYLFSANAMADVLYYAIVVTHQKINPYGLLILPSQISSLLHFDYSSVYRILADFEKANILINEPALEMKPYHLNKNSLFLFCPTSPIEKCYIDWFPLVELVGEFNHFIRSIEKVDDEQLLKSRFDRFIDTAGKLCTKARIQIETSIPRTIPIKDITFTELENALISIFEQMKNFLVVDE